MMHVNKCQPLLSSSDGKDGQAKAAQLGRMTAFSGSRSTGPSQISFPIQLCSIFHLIFLCKWKPNNHPDHLQSFKLIASLVGRFSWHLTSVGTGYAEQKTLKKYNIWTLFGQEYSNTIFFMWGRNWILDRVRTGRLR